ncbi:MAG: 6-phospho-beta-glucosidase [Streptosporangiales bacterium]|nr:6-phospho-beta-glucosidase [Streptosporangiales bacterium]
MKLTVIGGGSTYTPELVEGLARMFGSLTVDELVLVDPAAERLEIVGGLARRILSRAGYPGALRCTSRPDEGLDGADAVVLQLRVGGQRARIGDETIPLGYGCVGQETTGAGGLAKALRTVPVALDIARRARERAPGAWIIDFTNPVGIVTRALLDDGHRAVGLCNTAIDLQRYFAGLLGTDPSAVSLDHVGLNHLTWERAVLVDGVDVLPRLLDRHGEQIAARVGLPVRLLRLLGAVPSGYLRHYYAHDEVLREQRRYGATRGQRVAEIERELLDRYADPALCTVPDLLSQRGGAYYSHAALGLMASLYGEESGVHVLDVRNEGTLPFLSDPAVVEVPCVVGRDGVRPRPCAPVAPEVAGLIAHVAAYEELAVEAAVRGGRDRVFRALLAHPLIARADLADRLADHLVGANAHYLRWAR